MNVRRKINKRELLLFCLMAICSGMVIGLGGTTFLLAREFLGEWGRLIGAVLFSFGIFSIVTYEMRLFTGMVADIPKMGIRNAWRLPVCFAGNVFGVAFIALLVYCTPLSEYALPQAEALVAAKLGAKLWGASALCSSFMCGGLITLSVWSVHYAPKKGLSSTVGVLFPIVVFAFCGFDHSVANVLYFAYNGVFSWKILGYELLCVLGNILGGTLLPCISLLREKSTPQ